jgi:hypothetical protein
MLRAPWNPVQEASISDLRIFRYTLPISMDIPGPNDLTILDRYLLLAGPSGGLRQPVHFWTGFPGDRFRSCLVWQVSIV